MIKFANIKRFNKEFSPMSTQELLSPILSFLKCETPQAWIDEAKKPENLPIILIDHLICELKAGQSALFLINRDPFKGISHILFFISSVVFL